MSFGKRNATPPAAGKPIGRAGQRAPHPLPQQDARPAAAPAVHYVSVPDVDELSLAARRSAWDRVCVIGIIVSFVGKLVFGVLLIFAASMRLEKPAIQLSAYAMIGCFVLAILFLAARGLLKANDTFEHVADGAGLKWARAVWALQTLSLSGLLLHFFDAVVLPSALYMACVITFIGGLLVPYALQWANGQRGATSRAPSNIERARP